MSIQDKIENANISLRRKLFDNQINLMGVKSRAIRIKMNQNQYGDGEYEIILKDEIECVINYPGDIPLTRNRSDSVNAEISDQHIYLFDIIPIDLYTKWTDNVEKGDILIHKIKNEQNQYTTFILQVSEMVGTFRSNLIWRKGRCAPYNGNIPSEVQTVIDNY